MTKAEFNEWATTFGIPGCKALISDLKRQIKDCNQEKETLDQQMLAIGAMHGTKAFEGACYKHLTNKVNLENKAKELESGLQEQMAKLRSMQYTVRIRRKEISSEKGVRAEVRASEHYTGPPKTATSTSTSSGSNTSPLLEQVINATVNQPSEPAPAYINLESQGLESSSKTELEESTSRIAELEAALALEKAKQVIARDLARCVKNPVRVKREPNNNSLLFSPQGQSKIPEITLSSDSSPSICADSPRPPSSQSNPTARILQSQIKSASTASTSKAQSIPGLKSNECSLSLIHI